jgi:hypothetical protein
MTAPLPSGQRRVGPGCLGSLVLVVVVVAVVAAVIIGGLVILVVAAGVALLGLVVLAFDRVASAVSPRYRKRKATVRPSGPVWRSGVIDVQAEERPNPKDELDG